MYDATNITTNNNLFAGANPMNHRRGTAGVFCALTMLAAGGTAQADTIFMETFNDVFDEYFPFVEEYGIPVVGPDANLNTVDGADNDWYGARFGADNGGPIVTDVAVQSNAGPGHFDPVARFEDDTGILIDVDTTNVTDLEISFDWRMFNASTTDRVVFGYFVGDLLDTVMGEGLYDSGSRSMDLRNVSPDDDAVWSWGNAESGWHEVVSASGVSGFTTLSFNLPEEVENEEHVWFAWWLDNGEGDYAKLDNIIISGLIVPVPAALPLLISGLLGFLLLRRRVTV